VGTGNGGGKINVSYPGSNGDQYTGFYTFYVSAPGKSKFTAGQYVDLFCFELQQQTDPWNLPNTDVVYTIGDPSDGPLGSSSSISQMGDNRANLLRRLYADHYAKLKDNNDDATDKKAFQMAVWEIVHETTNVTDDTKGNSFKLTDGQFSVNNSETARDRAQGWLNGLTTTNGSLAAIQAFMNITKQDQLYWDGVSEVPVPSALVSLLGLGLTLGIVRLRRRRRQA
jgi:hypothetical protein